MNKRIGAAFIVMLFALGIVSIPVSAHFTLGVLTPTYDFHANDYDPHVAGIIGYVWPGIGYSTTAAGIMAPAYPGYQSPYPGGNPGTKGSRLHWALRILQAVWRILSAGMVSARRQQLCAFRSDIGEHDQAGHSLRHNVVGQPDDRRIADRARRR